MAEHSNPPEIYKYILDEHQHNNVQQTPFIFDWVRTDTQTGRPDKRACRVQYAFKDSMTHVLRVALIFAVRYVLHRRESRVIRC